MTRDQFWQVVDRVKGAKKPEAAIAKLLRKLSPPELISYQEHFDTLFGEAYRWDLWGAAYIIGARCSDDGFIEQRCSWHRIFRGACPCHGVRSILESLTRPETTSEKIELTGAASVLSLARFATRRHTRREACAAAEKGDE